MCHYNGSHVHKRCQMQLLFLSGRDVFIVMLYLRFTLLFWYCYATEYIMFRAELGPSTFKVLEYEY